jgi:hypothetical protein
MRRIVVLGMFLVLGVVPAAADTQVGQTNTATTKVYSFTMRGEGQVGVSLSWLNGGADLVMTLVCGETEPVVFGSATGGGLQRFAQINAGIPSDTPCEVGVTASRNGSKFWINIMQQADSPISARGRVPRTATGGFQAASNLTPAVFEQLERLVRISR